MSFESIEDQQLLEASVKTLEFASFTAKAAKFIGKPMEFALDRLPKRVADKVETVTQACLNAAFKVVLLTVDEEKRFKKANNIFHKGLVTATGAAGGFFGGLTMAIELPVSTGIMMRSIAEIAREMGEDLTGIEPRLACIQVLGLDAGSRNKANEHMHTSKYFAIRRTMATEIVKATEYYAANALSEEAPPIVARLLNRVAERFGIQITDKMAAELIPVVGAVTGGGINLLFMHHFQTIARGHFGVRQLERKYGVERTQLEYEAVLRRLDGQAAEHDANIIDIAFSEAAATTEEE